MKRFLLVVFVVFLLPNIYAAEKFGIDLRVGAVYFADRGLERNSFAYNAEISVDQKSFDAFLGGQIYADMIDFTLSGDFYPSFLSWNLKKNDIRIGMNGIYHFQNQTDLAFENDFLFNVGLNLLDRKGFSFLFKIGYGLKTSQIQAVKDNSPWIFEGTMSVLIDFRKIFSGGLGLYVTGATFDSYRYPTFGAATYTLGAEYLFKNGVKPYVEVASRMSDMFTTAPYHDKFQIRFGGGYTF